MTRERYKGIRKASLSSRNKIDHNFIYAYASERRGLLDRSTESSFLNLQSVEIAMAHSKGVRLRYTFLGAHPTLKSARQ